MSANHLTEHGEPIDIGWTGGTLDAQLRLSVRPGMDQAERDKLLADLREAVDIVAPVRPARAAEQASEVAHNDGPSVAEAAANDRRWWETEKAGEQ